MALQDNPISNLHPILQSVYTDLLNRLTLAQTNFNSVGTDVTKVKSDITTHKSLLTQHTTDIGNRLRKDAADTTPYTLGVASATAMTDALRKGDTIGGFMRPYRKFRAVSNTEKGASVANGMSATIVDPLNGGGVLEIGQIRLKTISSPSLTTVITIKSNGVVIYTQSILVASIPVVGKVTDILSLSSNLPSDIVLPTTLTISASSGVFDITIDGLIVAPA